ncbi:hypothetical protein [Scandinavium sp.]|uniref:hypothetical protein n=1 Tax=Scandinavium sp. TaxID=2830653 RepID=UPI002896ADE9|nr:hypothetical protein [Scandinavium sp.]
MKISNNILTILSFIPLTGWGATLVCEGWTGIDQQNTIFPSTLVGGGDAHWSYSIGFKDADGTLTSGALRQSEWGISTGGCPVGEFLYGGKCYAFQWETDGYRALKQIGVPKEPFIVSIYHSIKHGLPGGKFILLKKKDGGAWVEVNWDYLQQQTMARRSVIYEPALYLKGAAGEETEAVPLTTAGDRLPGIITIDGGGESVEYNVNGIPVTGATAIMTDQVNRVSASTQRATTAGTYHATGTLTVTCP